MKISVKKTLIPILLAAGVLAALVTTVPYPLTPREILVFRFSDSPCLGTAAAAVKDQPGVVGVALNAGNGELHIGVRHETSAGVIAGRLKDAHAAGTFLRTVSPVEYKRMTGHYFRNGVTGSCGGGCGG